MARLAMLALLVVSLVGCGQPCDHDHLCALDSDHQLCDGKDWRPCDASDRNATVGCAPSTRVAVCSPSGWTFQNAPAPPSSSSNGGQ